MTTGSSRPVVNGILPIDLDDGLSDGELIGDLADQLRASFESIDALSIVLPRDRVTWRDFEVPGVPDGELPSIVQFQFATKISGSSERSVIDFLPPKHRASGSPLTVHAAAIPERVVQLSQGLATQLGADLVGVGLSSLCLLELAASGHRDVFDSGHLGVVAASTRYSEAIETEAGDITRSVARRHDGGNAGRDKAAAAEQRRLELNFDDDTNATIVTFADTLDEKDDFVRVMTRDDVPFGYEADHEIPWNDAAVLAAAGAVSAFGSSSLQQINFAAPRQPVPPRNYTKDLTRLAIAAVALAIVGVGWKTWSDAAELDDKIETTRSEIKRIDQFLDAKGDLRSVRTSLEKHISAEVPLGDIFENVLAAMPSRDRLLLASLQPIRTTGEFVARVKGKAYGATLGDLERFEAELDRVYQVRPQAKPPSDDRPGYAYELNFEFDVPRPKEEKSKPAATQKATTTAVTETESNNADA